MKRFALKLLSGVALALSLAPSAQADDFRIGLITPPPHRWTLSANDLAEKLAAESQGRHSLKVFHSGQLGSEAQMLQLLQSGALDMAFLTVGELTNRDPDFGILTAPYLVKDAEGASQLLAGDTAKVLMEKLPRLGLHGFGFGMAGMRIVLLSKPLEAGQTVAGRKIRTVPLAQELDFWSRAGAAPTPLPLPDLFDAYTNGQIDGMQLDLEGTFNTRYQDYSAAVVNSKHMIFPMVAVFSARKWATLKPEDQALLTNLMELETSAIRQDYPSIDESYRAKLQELGAPLVEAGPEIFGTAVESWYEEWRKRTPLLIQLEAEAAKL